MDDEENHPVDELAFLSAFSKRVWAGDLDGIVTKMKHETMFAVCMLPQGHVTPHTVTMAQHQCFNRSFIMSALSGFEHELRKGLEEYPIKPDEKFSYGTAGFRTL